MPPLLSGGRPLVALLLLLSAACGRGDGVGSGRWGGSLDTLPNGAVLVRSPAQGVWGPGEEWRLVEDLRIGSMDVEGPELFGRVAALEVDPQGRIYVLDSQAREVRVFGPGGEHVRSFGRKGGGPGEFESPASLDWDPQGRLWVMDQGNARFSVFDTTGAFVTSHRRPGGFTLVPWPGGMDTQGRLYDVATTPGADGWFEIVLVRLDENVQPADTFRIPPYEGASYDHEVTQGGKRRSRTRAAVPFSPSQVWTRDSEGYVWAGTTDRYRIARLSFAGDTVRVVEREAAPVSVSPEEREEAIEGLKWFTDRGGKLDPSRIPDMKPAFRRIHVDGDGYLWTEPATPAGEAGAVLDVFDPDGRYLGAVRPEARVGLDGVTRVRGDRMYAVVRDELDVPYVVRFRIEGRPSPAQERRR